MTKSFFSKCALALVSAALVSAQSCDWLTQDSPTGPLYIKLSNANSATYPNAATTWNRIAIDGYPSPTASSIIINTGDFTYSSSSGQSVAHSVTKVPYAAAFGCVGTNVADGLAKIDLTGTPFSVQSGAGQFKFGGWYPKGVFSCTSDNKQCTLNCGGYCGYCGPATGMNLGEDANRRGGKYLVLDVADKTTFAACITAKSPSSSPSPSPSPSPSSSPSPSPISCNWLQKDTNGKLFVTLPSGNSATYPNAATTWNKVAIDGFPQPTAKSVTIDTGDFTYSSSSGQSVAHSVTKVPYAAAFGCVGTNVADGLAKIDLTGTPFSVQSGPGQFKFGGWYPKGVFSCTSDNKQCTLNCGGYCGFCGPATGMNLGEDANRRGGKYLLLDVADQRTFSYCINQVAPKCDWLQKDTNGKYYVTLPSGNSATYPNAATTWNKVAISGTPSATATSVTIDTGDFTYSSSSGQSVAHSVTKVPYAAAFGCVGTNVADGLAKIDLTGTPFSVRNGASQFTFAGWYPKGVFSCTSNNKQCTLNCGGYCGFCGPVAGMNLGEDANRRGGSYLVLDVADTTTYSYCAALTTAVSSTSTSHSSASASSFTSNMQVILGVFVCVLVVQLVVVAVVLRRRRQQPLATSDHVQLEETTPSA